MKIDLSVIVIGYNVEKYILRCLNSLLDQLVPESELLFVDDGSTDQTSVIVQQLFNSVSNINCRYYYKQNGGANSARIYGFEQSNGSYITFIDGDDWVEGNYISKILQYIGDECDIGIFRYQNVNSENEFTPQKNIFNNIQCNRDQFLDRVFKDIISHYFWDKIFKKKFLIESGFCDIPKITMGDDLAAHIKIGLRCPKVKCYQDVLYNYYNDGSGVSRKPGPKTAEIVNTLLYIEQIIKSEGLYERYVELINFHYFRSFLFYVVKNKYGWTDVQKVIYKAWKSKNININKNKYIQEYMSNTKKELMLAKIYDFNSVLGRIAAFVYLKLRRGY